MVPDSDYRIKLPVFEGPLDLLLFLIRKNEIDIYDIPIVTVTQQYVDVIKSMQQLDLEIAGDFFVMAATLMEIKSRMLLPKGQHAIDPNAEDDDAMDPRWELVHQLLQYKKFKEAARDIDNLATFQRDMLPRHVVTTSLTEAERPLRSGDRIELWNAFNIVLRRLAEKLVVGEIKDEQVTVADQMELILKRLETEKTFIFSHLFAGKITLRVLVATFIAVLELARLQKLRVKQDDAFTDIICTAVEMAAVPHVIAAPGAVDPVTTTVSNTSLDTNLSVAPNEATPSAGTLVAPVEPPSIPPSAEIANSEPEMSAASEPDSSQPGPASPTTTDSLPA